MNKQLGFLNGGGYLFISESWCHRQSPPPFSKAINV